MNPNELRAKKAELLNSAKAIQSAADAMGRDLSEAEGKKIDELLAQADTFEAQAKTAEADEEKARARRERLASLQAPASTGRKSAPENPTASTVEVKEPNFTKDPMKGFASPKEYLLAVQRNSEVHPSMAADERLKFLAAAGTDEQQTSNNSYGNFLVPEGMSPNMLSIRAESNPIISMTTSMPMGNVTLYIPARVDKDHTDSVSGGLVVSRRAETASMASSRMEMEKVKFEAFSLYGFNYVTEELLRDSPQAVAAIIAAGFADEFASNDIKEFLSGTGVGEWLGILKSPAKIAVAKETGQAADTILGKNILNMRKRAWDYDNCVWMANHDTYAQLATLNVSGTNSDQFLFNPARGEDVPDRLLNRPIYFSEYAETLGDEGDLILVNPTQYLTGLYQPLESAESIHVRFDRHERAYKFWLRNAGAPWWRAALKPKKSAETLSPIVTLAVRA